VITRLNVGGPATHVILVDRGLLERGWGTLLLHGQVEGDEAEIDLCEAGIPLQRVASLARPVRPLVDAQAFATIVATIRRFRPHVIHTHLSKAGLVGRAAAIASSKAIRVHTFHGNVFGGYFGDRTSGAIVRAERFLGHRTHRVIALSDRQRSELLQYAIAPRTAIRVVPLGLDLARFQGHDRLASRDALGIPSGAFVVMAVGRLVPIKRLDRLVRAFARVAALRTDARLYLVGDGSERAALKALVAEHGLSGQTTFAGWSTDTPRWYASSDVIVLTSEREGTPLAVIEAAAAGRPVVAVDVGGVADVVADGISGFVVPADDMAAFADRLIRLASDRSVRERMGAAGPNHALRFDSRRLVDDLDRLYRDALAETGNKR